MPLWLQLDFPEGEGQGVSCGHCKKRQEGKEEGTARKVEFGRMDSHLLG